MCSYVMFVGRWCLVYMFIIYESYPTSLGRRLVAMRTNQGPASVVTRVTSVTIITRIVTRVTSVTIIASIVTIEVGTRNLELGPRHYTGVGM